MQTPIGNLPTAEDLNLNGLALSEDAVQTLFDFDRTGWAEEFKNIGSFLDEFGDRLTPKLRKEHAKIVDQLND